jgi:hypothetical protein
MQPDYTFYINIFFRIEIKMFIVWKNNYILHILYNKFLHNIYKVIYLSFNY